MADKTTLEVYAARAGDYARMVSDPKPGTHLKAFMAALPAGGRVLDLGCGPGNAAATMQKAGFVVDAWDGSPEMAETGRKLHGIEIRVATFDALDADAVYDGIYANFSLLHARKSDMPDHLTRITTALKPGGILHIGLKTGSGEKRDAIGRFYAYYTEDEIIGLLEATGLTVTSRAFGEGAGLSGENAPWIILQAGKDD